MADPGARFIEHRRAARTRLSLRGRFLLSDGGEHPCETIDISVTGICLRAMIVADLREHIIAYIDELGRMEGVVARRGVDWFAIEVKIAPIRIERLAQKLAVLSGDAQLAAASAQGPRARPTRLRTEFGQDFPVEVRDQTRFSARIVANFNLLPGARVFLDQKAATVVGNAADGFLIDFD